MLHIRDDAFASLHGAAPAFTVTDVQNDVDDRITRRVTGTFTVPNYLTGDGSPGNRSTTPPAPDPTRCRCATATSPPSSSATSRAR